MHHARSEGMAVRLLKDIAMGIILRCALQCLPPSLAPTTCRRPSSPPLPPSLCMYLSIYQQLSLVSVQDISNLQRPSHGRSGCGRSRRRLGVQNECPVHRFTLAHGNLGPVVALLGAERPDPEVACAVFRCLIASAARAWQDETVRSGIGPGKLHT